MNLLLMHFGTDGIRGIAGKDLTAHFAFKFGNMAGQFFLAEYSNGTSSKEVCIGRDTRISSGMIEAAVTAGLCAAGVRVGTLGVVPTPAVSYAVANGDFMGGIMVSASHNPYDYNGLKVFDNTGVKLNDLQESKIERLLESGELKNTVGCKVGALWFDELSVKEYQKMLRSLVEGLEFKFGTPKVLIDCANGSASVTANAIFGCLKNVQIINCNPDGLNINKECGSLNINSFADNVQANGYDIGFAFDGDADRCLMVSPSGKILDGDNILMILAKWMMRTGNLLSSRVVVTKMSNLGVLKALDALGLKVTITDVGDRQVIAEMLKSGCNLGAENSGHIICLDYSKSGDGQLTACLLLKAIAEGGLPLNELGNEFKRIPQICKTVPAKNNKDVLESKILNDTLKEYRNELGDDGRIVLRASGTEPVIRMVVEGENLTRIEQMAVDLEHIIRNS